MYRRTAVAILACFNVALGLLVLWFLARGYKPLPKEAQALEYKDFISILLTGLGLMMAVGTVMLAAAAIWGFEAIRKEIRISADAIARETATLVAKEVAGPVAARTAREVGPSDTSPTEAGELVDALAAEEAQNGNK
jgi:hypothetical protein